ncbi:beta strand repeat-containing protein [Hymenobacter cellulosivorans]|uniref:PA14 domain-containing protein n=1 Tax=Hymenobacter cellulosivorans TaxID=2932249 RepID=A0ABY4F8A6_9BACT|nr:PA14 domain-containing protein [Hymenobacter cellulosivorans]UOQ52655.1 PA14 domain-containing protein [Hymenobacter cellulosivorans]
MHFFTAFTRLALSRGHRIGYGQTPRLWLILLLLLPGLSAQAQRTRGSDGNRTVSTGTAIVNEYAKVTADAAAGATLIRVSSNTLNANGRFLGVLTQGDLILLIQMQGASITTNDAAIYGSVSAYNNAGRYELLEVASVSGTDVINLTCGLKYDYTAAGQTQVVRLPRFNTLTVNSGATVSGTAWDRTTGIGGIVAMEVANGTILNGTINATGLGFRGGAVDNSSEDANAVVFGFRNSAATFGAEKGEGIAGAAVDYDALGGRYGRGAAANGGGGGNSHNAAGGGGANVGLGAWTGMGNPDRGTSSVYDNAWNLEGAGFATATSSGGGRGGYSYASANQDALVTAPGAGSWGGNGRQNNGGYGGRPLENRGRLYLGGGGGAGDGNNGVSTSGGNGGGLVYMLTGGAVSGSGSVLANGTTGFRGNNIPTSGGTDAAGGGGGGGSVVLHVGGTITGITASAQGGTGGSQRDAGAESEGPGGGGGGGLIQYTNNSGTNFTTQVQGGVNGTTSSTSLTEFPPNGATRGGSGLVQTVLYNAQCAVADVASSAVPLSNPTPAGQPGGFTVTFNNTGPDGANEVIAQVKLPTGLSILSITNGGEYNPATGFVNYPALTSLASGQSLVSTIRFTTPPVTSVPAYPLIYTTTGQGNNTQVDFSYAEFTVTPVADVTTSITGPVVLGQGQPSGTYTVNFTNNGPSTAANVTQSILLPAGSTGVSAPGAQSIVVNGNNTVTVTYPAASLTSGATNSFQLSFTAPATAGPVTLVSNTGTSTSQGSNAAADQFTFNANVTAAAADLQANITVSTTPVPAGQEGVFNVVFRNNGPNTATGTAAQVQLPAGLVLTDNAGGSYNQSTGLLTFPALTSLGNGATFSPVIKFTAPAAGTSVAATASITSSAYDSNTGNNSFTASIAVTPTADVVTTISGPATAAAGASVTYTATVQNNGPSVATSVVPTVQLPKALLSLALPTGASYDPNTGIVTLPAINSMNSGDAQNYTIGFTLPNNNQSVSGQARATAATNDAAVTNNNGSLTAANVTTTVTLPAGSCAGNTFSGQSATQGLYAEYYKGYFNDNFNYFSATPALTRTISTVNYSGRANWGDITAAMNSGTASDPDNYSSRMRGYITITTGGTYTFGLFSDDAAWLWVGNNARDTNLQAGKAVVNASGTHSAGLYTGTISLAPGTYPVTILYGEAGGDNVLVFSYSGPDTGNNSQTVPSSVLCSTQFGGPLPVELTQFTATANNLDAQLSWATAQEKNSAYFEVERSVAGQPFRVISQVKAAGTTTQGQRYAFLDAGAARLATTAYYRLRQVDQDGTSAYSPVRTVTFGAAPADFSVTPNPTTAKLRVQFTDASGQATATVYSVLGQALLTQALNPSGEAELDVRSLPAGSYVLRLLTSQGVTRNFHFVKQ